MGEGAEVEVTTQLLDLDAKRAHLFHVMRPSGAEVELATEELMLLHVDARGPKAVPFPPDVAARLEALSVAHAAWPRPPRAGRAIAIRR